MPAPRSRFDRLPIRRFSGSANQDGLPWCLMFAPEPQTFTHFTGNNLDHTAVLNGSCTR
jgi:hypothetical protein